MTDLRNYDDVEKKSEQLIKEHGLTDHDLAVLVMRTLTDSIRSSILTYWPTKEQYGVVMNRYMTALRTAGFTPSQATVLAMSHVTAAIREGGPPSDPFEHLLKGLGNGQGFECGHTPQCKVFADHIKRAQLDLRPGQVK